MNFQPTSGFDHFSFDPPLGPMSSHSSSNVASNALNADRIPPPASVATINGDAIDLNDEVFFHTAQNAASPVPLNSNYLLDSYPMDPVSFSPEIPKPPAYDPLKSGLAPYSYGGASPGHMVSKPRDIATLGSNMVSSDPNLVSRDPNMVSRDPNIVSSDPNLASSDPNLVSSNQNIVSSDSILGQFRVASQESRFSLSEPEVSGSEPHLLESHFLESHPRQSHLSPTLSSLTGKSETSTLLLRDSTDAHMSESDLASDLKSALSTPDLAFAEPMSYNVHYSHQNRFSTAVEQMHRMSLHGRSSSTDFTEEKTINPRQLLEFSTSSSISSLQNYSLASPDKDTDTYMQGTGSSPDTSAPELLGTLNDPLKAVKPYSSPSAKANRYLSTSVSSPQLSTFFSQQIPDLLDRSGQKPATSALNNPLNPYVMNDECVSAITYWLNNTADVIQEKEKDSAYSGALGTVKHSVRGPGVSKAHWNRRNSIQVVPGSVDAANSSKSSVHKRKRRKSDHLAVKDDKATAADFKFMARSADSASDSVFAMISESEPSAPSTMSTISDLPEQTLEKKPEPLDTGDGRTNDQSRAPTEAGLGPLAEGEDDGPKPFPCPDCEKQFKRSEHLKRHIRSVHSNIRPFHCKYCEKKFSRSDNLAQHSKTHFKINPNGTTSVIYGNPNPYNRGGRKQSVSEMDLH